MAQQEIKGTIYDINTRSPLTGASVTIYTADKSIPKGNATTDDKGHFTISNPPNGNYNLIISYMGYKAERIAITVTGKTKVYALDLKQTGLSPNIIKLTTVDIKGIKPLINIRKDTIEFSASDFYTAENASLKSLMQKIPGLTVGDDGSFYFQGKKIEDLYIDGRPAFSQSISGSGDPKMLSQIIQASNIDKFQIADKRGISGIPQAGNTDKVINITIKKEMKKGVNGTLGGAYGTDGRYASSLNANMFRNDKQIMLNGMANNNNNMIAPVGSNDEIMMMQVLQGITEFKKLQGNGSFDLSKNNKINFNLGGLQADNLTTTHTYRTNILPDSTFQYNSDNRADAKNKEASFFFLSENKLDEKSTLTLALSTSLGKVDNTNSNTFTTTGKTITDTINNGHTHNTSNTDKNSYMFSGFFIHNFNKEKRFVSLNVSVNHQGNVNDQNNFTLNQLTQVYTSDTINQHIHAKTTNNLLSVSPVYQEPISNSLVLNLSYMLNYSVTRNEQYAFDFDYFKMRYTKVDDALTYVFKNTLNSHVFTSGLVYNKGKIFGALSIAYNITNSTSTNFSNNTTFNQDINYWSPNLGLTYKINNFKTLNVAVSRNAIPVKPEFLIPIVSLSNPLYIKLGNPDLKPPANNTAILDYSSFSIKGTTFGIRTFLNLQTNGIGNSVYSDSIGRQITKPVNVKGNFTTSSIFTIGKRLNDAGLTINYRFEPMVDRNTNYINQLKNSTTAYTLNQGLVLNWTYKKLIESNTVLNWVYTGNNYSIQQSYFDFLLYSATINLNTYLPLNFNIGGSLTYSYNTAQHITNTLLNLWISRTWLADKSLQSKIFCFDLLKKFKSFSTLQTYSYIEQTNTNNLTQYLMGSLTWYFGKKKPAEVPK
ncbi:TonB-dependent receptor [Chitinophaga silvatica]|uniref:TonB-dependent receptor n=1 Tax=Chitinophaga silvatica TaxID=2282649 RepID=UPI001314F919|nr:TonB-dependent receptor [Chitinophaga silvatica]